MIHDITTSWQELQIENDLCDVTLACEDNQIKAYKIIYPHMVLIRLS